MPIGFSRYSQVRDETCMADFCPQKALTLNKDSNEIRNS
jgi:hypothetical protein